MKRLIFVLSFCTAGIGLGGLANAQQPPDTVSSDLCGNTAMGTDALLLNANGTSCATSGTNTAVGNFALIDSTTGTANTATGYDALAGNGVGSFNTAAGVEALSGNQSGDYNTSAGYLALSGNTTGNSNAAFGALSLGGNGSNNSAFGTASLELNSTGNNNTAIGDGALVKLATGSSNVALGAGAGGNITGSNNIDIGNSGLATDNRAIRIGTGGTQTAVFIAGISNSKITGSPVYVTAGGRLGVLASSERYKTAIAPIGSDTTKLQQLRPVKFHLKTDPHGAVQYGLIAEEVAKVYPELVIRDENGRIEGVRYDELAPMLLNEMQKQAAKINSLEQQVVKVNDLERELAEMHAALVAIQSKDQLVAQR